MKKLYSAKATASGGRAGKVQTEDGKLELDLSMPKSMGGDDGPGTNPEQLFACAYSACFHSALKLMGRLKKIDTENSSVSAIIDIGTTEGRKYGLAATIEVYLPGVEKGQAEELMIEAHKVCPFSNAVKDSIEVVLRLQE
jgi:Ohr subfamily peroxiredoxin